MYSRVKSANVFIFPSVRNNWLTVQIIIYAVYLTPNILRMYILYNDLWNKVIYIFNSLPKYRYYFKHCFPRWNWKHTVSASVEHFCAVVLVQCQSKWPSVSLSSFIFSVCFATGASATLRTVYIQISFHLTVVFCLSLNFHCGSCCTWQF